MTRAGEFEWIERYLAPLATENSFALKDDAAILPVPDNHDLVVTQDAILETIHFLGDDPLDTVARKALRVNISDAVAKGAIPYAYSLALGVPDSWGDEDMALFASGLAHDQQIYDIKLTGGDTYRSPDRLCVAVTLFAAAPKGKYRSRLTAHEGDLLVVSGTIGNAAIGLKVATGQLGLPKKHRQTALSNYRLPDPLLALAPVIAQFATASMDISDGLLGDCRKLCSASGLAAKLTRTQIPLSPILSALVAENPQLWEDVLTGGDDYQCLFCVNPADWPAVQRAAGDAGVAITTIGEMIAGDSGKLSLDMGDIEVSIGHDSYSHF